MIRDTLNLSNQGIIFKDHNALQEIYKQSGEYADSCEFQVHYWSLVFRHKAADSSIFDIAIPIVYFNYKQEVSGARIDFEMSEVSEISNKLLPIAQIEAGKILKSDFPIAISSIYDVTFTPLLVPLNSIHKHPGSSKSQAFSGTDLDRTATDHGVVYPLQVAKNDAPNFAGIMALDGKENNMAHFEYRIVNGELGKDIHYQQGRCLSICIEEAKQSAVEKLLGYKADIKYKAKNSDMLLPQIKLLRDIYKSINYKPFTLAVRPENLTRRAIIPGIGKYYQGNHTQTSTSKVPTKPKAEEPKVKIYEEAELVAYNEKELMEILTSLEAYYYETSISTLEGLEEYSRKDLLDEIIDLQINIIAEMPRSRDEMINELVKKGWTRSRLVLRSDEEIELMYDLKDFA